MKIEILQGNRLIADFIGIPIKEFIDRNGDVLGLIMTNDEGEIGDTIDLYQPDINWEHLMYAVEKISAIPLIGATEPSDVMYPRTFGMPSDDGRIMVRFNGSFISYGKTLIEATWNAVVEFLKREKEIEVKA